MTYTRPATSTVDAFFKPAKQTGDLGSGGNVEPGVSRAGTFIDNRNPNDIVRNAALRQRETEDFIGGLLGLVGGGGGSSDGGGTNSRGGGIIFDVIDGQASKAFGEFAANGGLEKLRSDNPEYKETVDWLQTQNPLFRNRVEGARALGGVEEYTKNLAIDTSADERLSDPNLTPEQKAQIKAEIQAPLREKYLTGIPGKFLAPLIPALTEREASINSSIYGKERSKQLAAGRGAEARSVDVYLDSFGTVVTQRQKDDPTYDGVADLKAALPNFFMSSSSIDAVGKANLLVARVQSRVLYLTSEGRTEEAKAILDGFTKLGQQGGVEFNNQNAYNLALNERGSTLRSEFEELSGRMGDIFKQKNDEAIVFGMRDRIEALAKAQDYDGLADLAANMGQLRLVREIASQTLAQAKEQETEAEADKIADLRLKLYSKEITKDEAMKIIKNDGSLSGAAKLSAMDQVERSDDNDPAAKNFAQAAQAASRNTQAADKAGRLAIENINSLPSDPKVAAALQSQLASDIGYNAMNKTAKQAEAGIAKGEKWDAKTYNDAYLKNLKISMDEEVKKQNNETVTKNAQKTAIDNELSYIRRAASQGLSGMELFSPRIQRMAKEQGKPNPQGARSILEEMMRGALLWKAGSREPVKLFGKKEKPNEVDDVRVRNMIESQTREGQKARDKQRGIAPRVPGQRFVTSTKVPGMGMMAPGGAVDSLARNLGISDNYIAIEPNGKAFGGRTQTLYGIKAGTGYRADHEDHVHHAARNPKEAMELALFLSKKGHRITEFKGWKQFVSDRPNNPNSDHFNGTGFDIPGGPETHAKVLRDINEFYRNRAGINPGSPVGIAASRAGQSLSRFVAPASQALAPLAQALWGAQPGGSRNGANLPLSAVTPQGVAALGSLVTGRQAMGASTPALPQVAAAGRTGVLPQAISLNHPIYIAIGIAEGTRTADGGFTKAWHGHPDPSGRPGTNKGTVSNNSGKPAAVVDREWTRSLTQTMMKAAPFVAKLAQPGTVGYNRLMFNIADLAVQAPAALSDFIKKLPSLASKGFSVDAIAKARADSYYDPADGKWKFDKEAFGNYSGLLADQRRRAYAWEYKKSLGPPSRGKP